MATQSFWGRVDNANAKNPTANIQPHSVAELVFVSEDINGLPGNLVLQQGTVAEPEDPSTIVQIDGTSYEFVYELFGEWPTTGSDANKVPAELQGETAVRIGIIDYPSSGDTTYYLFSPRKLTSTGDYPTEATMADINNGKIALNNANPNPPPLFICFVAGTLIRTPDGDVPVELLRAGDLVVTDTGDALPIRWTMTQHVTETDLRLRPESHPIRIPAGSFDFGLPYMDLYLSPNHRVSISNGTVEMLFGEDTVWTKAKHIGFPPVVRDRPFTYHNILLDTHATIISNGLKAESLYLGDTAIDGLSPEHQQKIETDLAAIRNSHVAKGLASGWELRAWEAKVLRTYMNERIDHVPAEFTRIMA